MSTHADNAGAADLPDAEQMKNLVVQLFRDSEHRFGSALGVRGAAHRLWSLRRFKNLPGLDKEALGEMNAGYWDAYNTLAREPARDLGELLLKLAAAHQDLRDNPNTEDICDSALSLLGACLADVVFLAAEGQP